MNGRVLEHGAANPTARPRMSLRAKATLALLLLAGYALAMYAYIEHERKAVLVNVTGLDRLRVQEDALTRASLSLSDALFVVNRTVARRADDYDGGRQDLAFAVEELKGPLRPIFADFPELEERYAAVQAGLAAFSARVSLANLFEVRAALNELANEVDREGMRARERRRTVNDGFRRDYERIAAVSLVLGLAGLGVFGVASLVFFSRLAAEIDTVRERAAAIVRGYRGAPLAIARRDEVGDLARAVDRMGADLAERERRIELGARQQMHRERMAAIGAMAANVAHEIGNPLAAISGLAQEMLANRDATKCALCRPELMLEQTDRIARMTRQIAEFAAQRSADVEPVDLNALGRAACDVLRFDARLRHAGIVFSETPGLPAAMAVPDHVTHIVMNLVLASIEHVPADALDSAVEVRTGAEHGRLFVRVVPRISAAAQEANAKTFDDPARDSISRHLAKEMGGSLDIARGEKPGATLWLPALGEPAKT